MHKNTNRFIDEPNPPLQSYPPRDARTVSPPPPAAPHTSVPHPPRLLATAHKTGDATPYTGYCAWYYNNTKATTAGGVTCSPASGATCCSGRKAHHPEPFHSIPAQALFGPVHTAPGPHPSARRSARVRLGLKGESLSTPANGKDAVRNANPAFGFMSLLTSFASLKRDSGLF